MSGYKKRYAVNVALVPDEEGMERCFALSDGLKGEDAYSLLRRGSTIPHLTLWMGTLDEEGLRFIYDWVKGVDLRILLHEPRIVQVESGKGVNDLCHLVFEESDLPFTLHQSISSRMAVPIAPNHNEHIQFADEKVGASTSKYLHEFAEMSSMENYQPHVTIGYGEPGVQPSAAPLVMERLGIFLMGDACTCVKEWNGESFEPK